jgi:alkanesulfonate monooxygenase SsuD/methylene tetrahydromethanopterin reductase-like flavin-dependent oxidoreductase (luciferase family)
MDEQIEIVRGLAAGGWFEYHGRFYDVPAIKLNPVPTQPLPILAGGHADAALRRAARLCDGWMHAGSEPERVPEFLARLRELRREHGREDDPFEVHVASADAFTPDGCRRLEELGVTDAIVGFRDSYQPGPDTQTLQEKLDALRWFADDVIAKVRA